jgi:hypothetical protein
VTATKAKRPTKRTLYHGTPVPFAKGTRKVHPTPTTQDTGGYPLGWRIAHATSDLAEAGLYGDVVYEVAYDEHTQEGYGTTCYFSERGFRIIRRVS